MPEDKTIVIIDDHSLFRRGFASLVGMIKGYSVLFVAENGLDFIRLLNPTQLPAIVLLDIAMPGMDGYETVSWIKKNHPSIIVLALSMMESKADIDRMMDCGADGYILKDADPADLKMAFDKAFNRRKPG